MHVGGSGLIHLLIMRGQPERGEGKWEGKKMVKEKIREEWKTSGSKR